MEKTTTRSRLIAEITARDGYSCYLDHIFKCGGEFTPTDGPTIDHFVALANDGDWEISNLKLAHLRCNQLKADRKWISPGVLEERARQGSTLRERKQDKRKILDEFCELCYDGRLLLPGEDCPECETPAVSFPWSTKREPKECSHAGIYWCWACSLGIYEREPAIVSVLDGSLVDEELNGTH
jgi:hypothetical protein